VAEDLDVDRVDESAESDDQSEAGSASSYAYARALGARLRDIRKQQHLSLHAVERKSGGRWKAVVVGSYERGDRAVSVRRFAELAEFYHVPVGELLPPETVQVPAGAAPLHHIVINLDRLRHVVDAQVEPLKRFVAAIQRQRDDYSNQVLSLRGEDLRSLSIIYDTTLHGMSDLLVRWQVLAPQSLILDSE